MNGLLEILTNKHWMLNPDFLHSVRQMIQSNLNGHVALNEEKKEMGVRVYMTSEGFAPSIEAARYSAKDGRRISSWSENKDDPFINLMFVDGPITRNGGACSYGSVEHRDMMMEAADNANCVGHIFHINTPGGSAWAKNDYQQAIDYARSKKQPVLAFIDGMCASAGMYLAALCDERYYMHPKDQVGCIGVMAAFYTEADGSKNEYTNETYHELYDPESFDKNKEIRDIANDGNTALLIDELTRLGVEFRADVLAACPKAKDEHLHGKVFDAEKVKGILLDGQATLGEVFGQTVAIGKRNGLQSAINASAIINPLNNNINMKEKFPFIAALIDVEEMVLSSDGSHFDMERLEALNAKIGEMQQQNAELEQKLNDTEGAHQTAIETLKNEHQQAIDNLNAEHTAALEEKDKAIEQMEIDFKAKADELEAKNAELMTLTEQAGKATERITALEADLTGAQAALQTAQDTIAERDQQVSDLTAQIDELKQEPGAEPEAGASPQTNGGQAEQAGVQVGSYVYNPELSYKENMEAKAAFEAQLQK